MKDKYPIVLLKVSDFFPEFFLLTDETSSSKIDTGDEDIGDIILKYADILGLLRGLENLDRLDQLQKLLELARESDESTFDSSIDFHDGDELMIEKSIDELYQKLLKDIDPFDIDVTDEVLEQLTLNQNSDLFCSLLEGIYNILIGRSLILATDLGTGNIALSDDSKNKRLQEKMAKELENFDVNFTIRE